MRVLAPLLVLALLLLGAIACTRKADPQHPAYHCQSPPGYNGGEECDEYFGETKSCGNGFTPAPGACPRANYVAGCYREGSVDKAWIQWFGGKGHTVQGIIGICQADGRALASPDGKF